MQNEFEWNDDTITDIKECTEEMNTLDQLIFVEQWVKDNTDIIEEYEVISGTIDIMCKISV